MIERLPEDAESREKFDTAPLPEKVHDSIDKHVTHEEKASENPVSSMESIKHTIEQEAKSGKELRVETPENTDKQQFLITKELKAETLRRTLNRARKHLSKPDRAVSKAIHQPLVDAMSKVGEKTIARPTGLLTGALCALIGSAYVFYTAKHYGFNYNYSIAFLLFGGGYLLGLVIELIIYSIKRVRG